MGSAQHPITALNYLYLF